MTIDQHNYGQVTVFCDKQTVEKTEGAIKNGQYRDTQATKGIRYRTKTNKTKHRKLKRPHQKITWVNLSAREG